jgi:L-aminopeptidase/D-esterase-like protein
VCDITGFHVKAEHLHQALERASDGTVEEGGAGSGTGMICHGFKDGLGTAPRKAGEWTVGVLERRPRARVLDGSPGHAGGRGAVPGEPDTIPITMLVDAYLDPLFYAAIEATEAAIVNALLAAETMIGRDGITAHALTADRLLDAIERFRRG